MKSLLSLAEGATGYDPENLRVDIARRIILEALSPVSPIAGRERVVVREALGRVLAEDILSPIDVPAGDNSAMDGYALRASDLRPDGTSALAEAGIALAGRPYAGTVGAGECVRIMTGALMPAGTDTVVMKESVRIEHGRVLVPPGQAPGQNCRRAGEDLAQGMPALLQGTRVGSAELGLIASLGMSEALVRRRLRVALFSTGDELRDAADAGPADAAGTAGQGILFDSNRYTLFGLLTRLGCTTIDLGVIPDDPTMIEAHLRIAAASADLVITSGGVSVGDADFTAPLMARLGEALHWKLAMRPGRPLAFGRIAQEGNAAWLFGLPGNPVAAMIAFIEFVRPAILELMGAREETAACLSARTLAPIRKRPGRTEYPRGLLSVTDGGTTVRPASNQGSGILSSMSAANCLIVLDHDRGDVAAGELVPVQLLAGLL